MKKILAIGGSNSSNSINRKLAEYTAALFINGSTSSYVLSNVDIPIYSIQLEEKIGIPDLVLAFAQQIDEADFIVLSLAENNGSYNAGFKNLLDWTSRIKDRKIFGGKLMLLMATSPGARGGATVLEMAKNLMPRHGAAIKNTFSLPEFYKNFDDEKGIINEELRDKLLLVIRDLDLS